jgi:GNAT superfamily N-acetyltransferase
MADVSVRPAREDDAAEIGRLQVSTWRTAYGTILPARVLDGLDAGVAAQSWRAAITDPPTPRHRVLVALEQQRTVGFAALDGATGELTTLLVEPRWGRRGHGSRLLAAAVERWRSDGLWLVTAWIPESDRASWAFLESAGWAPDGTVRILDTGSSLLREVRLHVSLEDVP